MRIVDPVSDADWVSRFADQVVAEADERSPGSPIVCASGLSPSGPVHLGNLREVMTPHLVADEIARRGRAVVHLLSWDDYDRFRRVPAGVDAAWEQHIGKPLTAVPAPAGSPYANWAEHFKAPMVESLAHLGVEVAAVSQSERYTSGAYREQCVHAMRSRHQIDAILARYRTKKKGGADQAEDAEDGLAGTEYYPYKPYCTACGRDLTTIVAWDDETTEMTYECVCGHRETVLLSEFDHGKLVWKVDWPMRWAYEGVAFEPSGVDHSSPGSSFDVGTQMVGPVFGGRAPIGPMYAFVGITGMAKMSSSAGAVPTAQDALAIMEAPLLRWLYARRRPNQSFKVAFDQEIYRIHDEWDAHQGRVDQGAAGPAEVVAHRRSVGTAVGLLPDTPRRVAYRTLASIADVTAGDETQTLRILHDLDTADPIRSLDEVRPRADRARAWVERYMPEDQHTAVLAEPDREQLAELGDDDRKMIAALLAGLEDDWSLDGLTRLVYGVPKLHAGLPLDAKPTPELKVAQRSFFALLYRLLVGRETGPRLPTLLLAVGADRIRELLAL